MGDPAERELLLDEIFHRYDIDRTGELSEEMLQLIHSDMRVGGISIPQIEASIKYNCVGDKCERSELFDVLQEMDRRYFLIQDFRWEFSMLDTQNSNTITESQARWFVEIVHGKYFSNLKWERFLRQRAVPNSGVTFPEIEVMLCNIPSREEWLADQEEERREKEEQERQRRELDRMIEEEKDKRRRQREDDRKRREAEDMRKKLEEERRNREDEEERRRRQREKEEAARRKRKLEEEEERGRREAEERERLEKERKIIAEREQQQKEAEELARLKRLEEQHRQEEEERRRQELKEASDFEAILKDASKKEREMEAEAEHHRKRKEGAVDEVIRKEAHDAEQRALLKQREYRNKRLRYNLKVAIRLRDRDRLLTAVNDFKQARLPDDDLDLPKAEKILREFQARDGLRRAMNGRKLQPLEQAINFVKRNGFELVLEKEMIEAHKILLQLRRLERIRAEILELKQATVAEIRSYQKPPAVVHVVMTGTFLLLGHKEKETKDWKNVQALVGKTGKEGLKRRCLECDPGKIPQDAGLRAKTLLSQFELDEVRDVSAGAATFYVWSWTMIEEAEARQIAKKQEEEEKKRRQEEKKKKQQEEREKREQQGLKGEHGDGDDTADAQGVYPTPPVTPRQVDVNLKEADNVKPQTQQQRTPSKSPKPQRKTPSKSPKPGRKTATSAAKSNKGGGGAAAPNSTKDSGKSTSNGNNDKANASSLSSSSSSGAGTNSSGEVKKDDGHTPGDKVPDQTEPQNGNTNESEDTSLETTEL